jgi:hypothetical protein
MYFRMIKFKSKGQRSKSEKGQLEKQNNDNTGL